jgi:hypothetical protein
MLHDEAKIDGFLPQLPSNQPDEGDSIPFKAHFGTDHGLMWCYRNTVIVAHIGDKVLIGGGKDTFNGQKSKTRIVFFINRTNKIANSLICLFRSDRDVNRY